MATALLVVIFNKENRSADFVTNGRRASVQRIGIESMKLISDKIRPEGSVDPGTSFRRPGFGVRAGWLAGTAAMLLFLFQATAFGASKYWSGTKTWNVANSNWSSTTGGGAGPYTNATFATDDDAIFEGTAGTVTVSAPNNPNSLTFNVTAYTLSSGRSRSTVPRSIPTPITPRSAPLSRVLSG